MPAYDVEFLERESCGSTISSFRFARPTGYEFVPGQHLLLELRTAVERESKPFTISSAPGDDYLEVTTRLSGSPYKNALLGLAPGDHVVVSGPSGRLALPEDTQCVRFLVGGVGITPVRSILRDAVYRDRAWDSVLLFYGNRDPSCIPFIHEFAAMEDRGVRVVSVIEFPDTTWHGAVGFITPDLVRAHVDPSRCIFLSSGPPVMVAAMERVMDELGIQAERRMVERFGHAQ